MKSRSTIKSVVRKLPMPPKYERPEMPTSSRMANKAPVPPPVNRASDAIAKARSMIAARAASRPVHKSPERPMKKPNPPDMGVASPSRGDKYRGYGTRKGGHLRARPHRPARPAMPR